MADEVDVENVIAGLCAAALYPNGTSQPCIAGVPVQIFRGWPTVQQQNNAIAQNFVNVSIGARNGVERSTSRYCPITFTSIPPVHTLTATVVNNVITLGGTVAVPQNVFAFIGKLAVFSYAVQSTDTLTTIATALAMLIAAQFPGTTSSGPVITIAPSGIEVEARITSSGTAIKEVKRQEKSFQISIWAPPWSPPVPGAPAQDADLYRYKVAQVIDPALATPSRIVLPDNTYGHIHYERTITFDLAQNDLLYRRDLYYWVEYGTTIQSTAYEIGAYQTELDVRLKSDIPGAPVNDPFGPRR